MLDTLTRNQVQDLASVKGRCISLMIPTARVGKDRTEGAVRLKNGIEAAKTMLVDQGMRPTLAQDLLEPASALVKDRDFWMEQGEGLAALIGEGRFDVYRLDQPVQEMAVVGTHFHIRPLLAGSRPDECYILGLDAKDTRLLKMRGDEVVEVEVPDLPKSVEEALGPEYSEKQRQMRSVGPSIHLGSASHGAGDRGADPKDKELRFCQAVDRALVKFLNGSELPLVLAAAQPIDGIFRNATHVRKVLPEGIEGSPRRATMAELGKRAQAIVRKLREESSREAIERYQEMKAHGRAEHRIEELLAAARGGKVQTLLVDRGSVQWGFVEDGIVVHSDGPATGAEDLINLAVIETLSNSGEVIEVEGHPEIAEFGAVGVLRY